MSNPVETTVVNASVIDPIGQTPLIRLRRIERDVPGQTLLDATSGNTGIAYATIGASLGFRVTLCLPETVTPELKRILRAYGGEMVFTDPPEGSSIGGTN